MKYFLPLYIFLLSGCIANTNAYFPTQKLTSNTPYIKKIETQINKEKLSLNKNNNKKNSLFEFVKLNELKKFLKEPDFTTKEDAYLISRYDGNLCHLFIFSIKNKGEQKIIHVKAQSKIIKKIPEKYCINDILKYRSKIPYNS